MKLECALLLSILFEMAKCAIDFVDCGSILEVIDVKFGDCTQTPCSVERYSEVSVEIKLRRKFPVPPLESVTASAEFVHRGITWNLWISPWDICTIWKCPLQDVKNYTYRGKISFESIRYLRPGEVLVKTFDTWEPYGEPIFCASWEIYFI
ncbi:uncharacterized protein LOC126882820 [Diabrotica virgifera virgifera]|uniref:MD-2-related lipid-recognition domain-containing protein n=1 Tax=Diabrotica virgifera virgifera TaxID=50390 RepID=A0ABM5K104_DIAVI|nr:uncharacterized protein LOC126882820 [Diabrotica virgifera virgifera]